MKTSVSLDEIYAPVEKHLGSVPQTILDLLSGPNELARDVIRYFFSARGKLLRPALTFLGGALKGDTGRSPERIEKLAASFEIFHAATLIHDDIIDSAFIRRNLQTVHMKWDSQVAVLVGDYLHNTAIDTIFATGDSHIFTLFLKTAGIVCDGEIHELNQKGNFDLSEEVYYDIVNKKTASLMACALASGARLLGAGGEETEALLRFGRDFGIAFQIIDDCLDFTGDENEFGKTLGADLAAGVLTLPLIRLLEELDEKGRRDTIQIFRQEMTRDKVDILLGRIREHGTLDYAVQKAREFSTRARGELAVFPDSPARQSLEKLLDYVLERNR